MRSPVRIAVAGVGRMGRWHLDKARANAAATVVGIFDADSNRASDVAQATGVPSFENYERLLAQADAVIIAAATAAHFPLATLALEAGKHVLLEKPISRTVAEAESLALAAESRGLRLQVGFLERFRLELVRRSLGPAPVRYLEADRLTVGFPRESGTDVVADLMTHDLDLLHALSSADCASVTGIVDEEASWGAVSASSSIVLADGTRARLSASWVAHAPRRTLRIATETHWHEFDFLSDRVATRARGGEWVSEPIGAVDALSRQLEDFLGAIGGAPSIGASARDGLWALRVADGIRASAMRSVRAPGSEHNEGAVEATQDTREERH